MTSTPATNPSAALDRSEGDVNRSAAREAWQTAHLDEATRVLLDADASHYLRQSLSTPCLNAIERAEGVYLIDTRGRRIMDFHGNSAHQLGYGHARVVEAVSAELRRLPFCPRRYTNALAVELGRRLTALAPVAGDGPGRVLLAPGGAEAMSMAMKLARLATGRHETVSFEGSFHGATLDAISIGGEALFREGMGPLLPGAWRVSPPEPRDCAHGCGMRCTGACLSELEGMFERRGDRIGAVIAEPVRATTVRVPAAEYWARVRELCDRHGALLVFDEIPTALGRTGRLFACEHFGVRPDVLVLGKGLGGGVWPLAAMIARAELDVGGATALGHFTHEKTPAGCAAALATLDALSDERLVARSAELGAHAVRRLESLRARHGVIADVRGLGLMLAVELRDGQATAETMAERVMYGCLSRGLSFKVSAGRVLTLTPPLVIDRAELDRAIDVLDEAIAEATRRVRS